MIKLKTLIEAGNIPQTTFIKEFQALTGKQMSKASLCLLLNEGKELKRVNDFKNKITQTFNSIANTNYKTNELFINEKPEDKMIECANLTRETLKYFGLSKDPFMPFITKESEIVMLDSHYFALEMMRATRETGQFTVVTSEVGGGKTTVLGKFETETKIMADVVIVKVRTKDMDKCTTKDILAACVYDLSNDKPKRGSEALSRQVETLLKKHHETGRKVVLIIDEAQDLHTHTLKYLKRLWELRDGLTPLIGIILIGQSELATRLYNQNNLAVREVTARTIHAPLDAINKDLTQYLEGKIKNAKGELDNIITPDGIEALSEKLTIRDRNGKTTYKAFPLEVGNRIKRLMNIAYEQGVRVIDKNFINDSL